MKKQNIIYIVLGVVLLAALGYFLLRDTKKADGHDHNEAEAHKEQPKATSQTAIKEVELNEAQYKASDIVLGGFSMKNLSDVVNANGYTKLPPQNQADISVYLSGLVKTINVIEGEYVKKGKVLATIESLELAKLQEEYHTSKSNLDFLTLEYERQKTLSDENVNSKKVFQRTKSDFEIEKARYNSLQKQLNILNLGSAKGTASLMPVVASISGYITQVNVKIGSTAEIGKPLFTIVDNSKLHVDLLVYEKDLQKVKPGQDIRFTLTNQDNTEIRGKVFNISQSFENETKSVAVHADITNNSKALIPGMYVNALIDVGTREVQALPLDAVIKADGREFIFILEEGHEEEEHNHDEKEGHSHEDGHEHKEEGKTYHFQRIEVKTGTSQLGYVQVTLLQEIDKDAKIVLKGAYYIQSHLLKSEGGGGHQH
ncbi:efflux RND transporter periplasmic adaptor subunit [Flavobacterium cerinum]|uniref:Efflux RND transporter periplasmic adaptor subunit n=1 Tax=Flavobacterium cerinum TaxID=2502784 RepID=A0A3S3Q9B5_9FLAO|nr:efflux RND transporter periplasmic adaptor subunit [Flavobacterium cerinum]RWX00819.1 efflux RND transporter periplasmic adaptor subunit [Flavobacterium cerinum]